jgi:hypothetical protein
MASTIAWQFMGSLDFARIRRAASIWLIFFVGSVATGVAFGLVSLALAVFVLAGLAVVVFFVVMDLVPV